MDSWITIEKQELAELLRSRGFIVPDNLLNPKADRTPTWDKWQLIPKPALWHCVALSLNIDPDKVKRDAFGFPERVSDEFRDRIDVTCAPLRERHPADCAPIAERSPLSLRKFAAWVREFGWDAPDELLAMADQRPLDVNWNYWGALDLWPLDAACKLISGDNPNEPTRPGDIENPDPSTRRAWVNLFHTANAARMAGKLKVQAGCVYPAEFIVWARGKGTQICTQLLAMADDQVAIKADRAHSGKCTDPATATREARKAHRLGDLKRFTDDVYEAARQGDLNLGSGNDRKALPFSSRALRAVERHPEHEIEQATFNDDLPQISVKVKPGPKRMDIKYLRTMLAKNNQG